MKASPAPPEDQPAQLKDQPAKLEDAPALWPRIALLKVLRAGLEDQPAHRRQPDCGVAAAFLEGVPALKPRCAVFGGNARTSYGGR